MKGPGKMGGPTGAAAVAVVAALVYRGMVAAQLHDMPVLLSPVLDGAAHVEWARGILDGTWPGPEAFFRSPGYPYALAAALGMLGDDPARVATVQLFLGALVPGMVALLAGRLFGRGAAWVAGLGTAVYPTLAFFDAQLLAAGLAVSLTVGATLVSVTAIECGRRGPSLAAAALWSLAIVVRPPLLLPAIALPWFLRRSGGWTRVLAVTAMLAAGPLLVTARNAAVGDPAFIASQGGLNLYLGNGPMADGHSATFVEAPGAMGYRMLDAAAQIASAAERRELKSFEVSRYWTGRTLRAIGEDPGRWLALLGKKALLFIHRREIPNNHDPVLFATHVPALALPGWALWFPLAGFGAWRAWRKPGGRFVVVAALLVAAGCIAFFVNARFRVPAAPLIVALGAGGVTAWVGAARERAWRQAVVALEITVVVALLTLINPFGIPREASATSYVLLAEAERNRGEPVRSLRWIERALEQEPGLYAARLAQVELLRSMQRLGEALEVADRVLSVRPEDPAMLHQSAILLDLTGRPDAALERMARLLGRKPAFPNAAVDRTVMLVRAGRTEEAVSELRRIASGGAGPDAARASAVLRQVEAGELAPLVTGSGN